MDDTRINERIRVREVRLIDDTGEHTGIVSTHEAMARAQRAGLDLVEISDKSKPPVCRIMDYGQFLYQKAKKLKDSRKKLKKIVVKEVKMRPKIGQGDYQTKLKHAIGFLEHGDKVKFLMQFRGRENAHRDIGAEILQKVIADLDGIGTAEAQPRMEGQFMNMVVAPDAGMLRRVQRERGAPKAKSDEKPKKADAEDEIPEFEDGEDSPAESQTELIKENDVEEAPASVSSVES